ncbi:NUDIX domain-containing protein [Bacillus clarus]|uniref:NUDIX domain protein n=1 Tax=Bacillus clarus TaxID=2338372 RepID=A0A090YM06_9BACI|nr:NUDIX hydrolase [Bacillus clarus]KFM99484.1 NUDIX domain protein [Bacillus clarus]RFT65526.1 NUDIX domain-containing protein [Bacillus clarus]
MMSKLTFGYKKPTVQYVLRPSCYAVIFNTTCSKMAIIQKGERYFLPGGGMEGTEKKEDCLHRELQEELGWTIEIERYIGNAARYFYAEKEDTYYLNDGYFYIAQKIHSFKTYEEDHLLQWMPPLLAKEHLFHDHQKWAIEQVLLLQKQKGSPSI